MSSGERADDYKRENPFWVNHFEQWGKEPHTLPLDKLDFAPQARKDYDHKLPSEFGEEFRTKVFALEGDWAFLNHGSFGSALRDCLDAQTYYRNRLEAQPVHWIFNQGNPLLSHSLSVLGSFINASGSDLSYVPNATSALNAVARSLLGPHLKPALKKGDVIVSTDIAYGAVNNALLHICKTVDAKLVRIKVPYPWNEEEFIRNTAATIEHYGRKVRMVAFDHISSMPSFLFPIEKMVSLTRSIARKGGFENTCWIFVDGAHAIGNVPIDIKAIDADFYTSNCHKWLCCPKGTAFLHVRRDKRDLIRPPSISHGYDAGYQAEFMWPGTTDFTSYLSVPAAIKIFKQIGFEKICKYNHGLSLWAAKMLAEKWKTEVVSNGGTTLAMIRLPSGTYKAGEGVIVHDLLASKYKVEIPIGTWKDFLYCRASSQMYNKKEDYYRLGQAILEIQSSPRHTGPIDLYSKSRL